MKIPFQDEFELERQGCIFYIEATGTREWDEDGRVFTTLHSLNVTDERGYELNDNHDEYNDIKEHILYSNDSRESFEEEWDEEEIPYLGQ